MISHFLAFLKSTSQWFYWILLHFFFLIVASWIDLVYAILSGLQVTSYPSQCITSGDTGVSLFHYLVILTVVTLGMVLFGGLLHWKIIIFLVINKPSAMTYSDIINILSPINFFLVLTYINTFFPKSIISMAIKRDLYDYNASILL